MLNKTKLEDVLFLDIETVPVVYRYDELDDDLRDLWAKKHRYIMERDGSTAEEVYEKAGIYAEFAKVACISTAVLYGSGQDQKIRVKSFCGRDEKKLLTEFADMLRRFGDGRQDRNICGHNIKEFDVPFLARRMLINGVTLPEMLDIAGRKPWEVRHIDTMDLWKFGDYKHFTSLALLARIFGIPTPKDDISGADVGKVFWEDDDVERIRTYCEKDTVTVARILQKFKNVPTVPDERIEIAE